MKTKLTALLCALALTLGLAGCVVSTPDTVGCIGSFEVSSGLYLLAQFDAYQQAADLASAEQDPTNVKRYLRQDIDAQANGGESIAVSDYVSQKTLENLESYAAVEALFEELGGQLSAQQEEQADSYAQQLMDQYGETYRANGIGLQTLQRFERILLKSSTLLELVYGAEGPDRVSDEDLTAYLRGNMVELAYYVIPLYNTSTFAFASEEQTAQMLALAQQAADRTNEYAAQYDDKSGNSGSILDYFHHQAEEILGEVCAVLDGSADGLTLQTDLMSTGTLDSAFTQAGAADSVRELQFGQAAAIQYSSYAMVLALRLDPLAVSTLDELRSEALTDMKSAGLKEKLAARGAAMTHELDASAMKKLPMTRIVSS